MAAEVCCFLSRARETIGLLSIAAQELASCLAELQTGHTAVLASDTAWGVGFLRKALKRLLLPGLVGLSFAAGLEGSVPTLLWLLMWRLMTTTVIRTPIIIATNHPATLPTTTPASSPALSLSDDAGALGLVVVPW